MKSMVLSVCLIAMTLEAVGQIGDFTRSPSEHIINEVPEPFIVRKVDGLIYFAQGHREATANVLFEIQGPGSNRKIRKAVSDQKGHFKINAPNGTYRFKTTLDGFQSVMGTIHVTGKAPKEAIIFIQIRVGV